MQSKEQGPSFSVPSGTANAEYETRIASLQRDLKQQRSDFENFRQAFRTLMASGVLSGRSKFVGLDPASKACGRVDTENGFFLVSCQDVRPYLGGYAFQDWFYDVMDFFEVDNRRPYVVEGRQIDGSITIDGTTYLVELKFGATQADAPDIDSLLKKVNDKADNTMGIMVSMSGFSSVAIKEASFSKSPLLLLEHSHLYMVLGGIITLPDCVRRIRRHSSQEGKAFLPVNEFGGR